MPSRRPRPGGGPPPLHRSACHARRPRVSACEPPCHCLPAPPLSCEQRRALSERSAKRHNDAERPPHGYLLAVLGRGAAPALIITISPVLVSVYASSLSWRLQSTVCLGLVEALPTPLESQRKQPLLDRTRRPAHASWRIFGPYFRSLGWSEPSPAQPAWTTPLRSRPSSVPMAWSGPH